MASNRHSNSARIAFLFFLLLAFAVELHECRRAPRKDTPVLVQSWNRAWANSESVTGDAAQIEPREPAQVEDSVEQGVGPERLFMVTDKSPVPPRPINPSQPGGVTDKSPVPPTPLNPSQPGGITDKSPVPPRPINPSQPGGITDKKPVPPTPLNPSQPGNIIVKEKSPVPPPALNPSQPGARMLSAQD